MPRKECLTDNEKANIEKKIVEARSYFSEDSDTEFVERMHSDRLPHGFMAEIQSMTLYMFENDFSLEDKMIMMYLKIAFAKGGDRFIYRKNQKNYLINIGDLLRNKRMLNTVKSFPEIKLLTIDVAPFTEMFDKAKTFLVELNNNFPKFIESIDLKGLVQLSEVLSLLSPLLSIKNEISEALKNEEMNLIDVQKHDKRKNLSPLYKEYTDKYIAENISENVKDIFDFNNQEAIMLNRFSLEKVDTFSFKELLTEVFEDKFSCNKKNVLGMSKVLYDYLSLFFPNDYHHLPDKNTWKSCLSGPEQYDFDNDWDWFRREKIGQLVCVDKLF